MLVREVAAGRTGRQAFPDKCSTGSVAQEVLHRGVAADHVYDHESNRVRAKLCLQCRAAAGGRGYYLLGVCCDVRCSWSWACGVLTAVLTMQGFLHLVCSGSGSLAASVLRLRSACCWCAQAQE